MSRGAYTKDTVLGAVMNRYIDWVNWHEVDNEFALRAKDNYSANVYLTGYMAVAYNESTIVDMLETVLGVHKLGGVSDMLTMPVKIIDVEQRSFKAFKDGDERYQYSCALAVRPNTAAQKAREFFSNTFSNLGLEGAIHVKDRTLYLMTDSQQSYNEFRAMIGTTKLQDMRAYFRAKSVQLFSKECVTLPVFQVMDWAECQEIVSRVPDTFTVVPSEFDKVLVVENGRSASKRKVLGTYLVEGTTAYSVENGTDLDALDPNRVYVAPDKNTRAMTIFSHLVNYGISPRVSWLNMFDV
jgi:hypothetical protein